MHDTCTVSGCMFSPATDACCVPRVRDATPFSETAASGPAFPPQQQGQQQVPEQRTRSTSSSDAGRRMSPSFSTSMLQAAVSTAQWPINSLASSLGDTSKALLSAPVDLAKTGARMGSGLVWVRSLAPALEWPAPLISRAG